MRKFQQGTKVRVKETQGRVLKSNIHVVTGYSFEGKVSLEGLSGYHYDQEIFEAVNPLEIIKLGDLVLRRDITEGIKRAMATSSESCVYPTTGGWYPLREDNVEAVYRFVGEPKHSGLYINTLRGDLKSLGEMWELIYTKEPVLTPVQKEIKEIEESQRKLADRLAKLKEDL